MFDPGSSNGCADAVVSDQRQTETTALPDDRPGRDGSLSANDPTTLQIVELLLKEPAAVDRLNQQARSQTAVFSRLLLIAQASYLVYGLVFVLILNVSPATAYPRVDAVPLPRASWQDGTALALPLAYMIGIVLASAVCLPSFYFQNLLAGAGLSWVQITNLVGKGTASNAIMLLGLLPAYVALALGLIVFGAPVDVTQATLTLGLLLPFVAGLWGMWAIFLGVKELTHSRPEPWRGQRWCFLRRLVIAWSAVYAAVVPVMIYRLWELFAAAVAS